MAATIITKIAGVTFDNRQEILKNLRGDPEIELVRERYNRFDSNAIAVYADQKHVGYVPRDIAEKLSLVDEFKMKAELITFNGGYADKSWGLTIKITIEQ